MRPETDRHRHRQLLASQPLPHLQKKKAQVKGQELSFHRGLCFNPLYIPGKKVERNSYTILRIK